MSNFEKRPASSIDWIGFEGWLREKAKSAQVTVLPEHHWIGGTCQVLNVPRVRYLASIEEVRKFGIAGIDANNAHIGEAYPIPVMINKILARYPAYGKVYDNNKQWDLRFHTNVQTLCAPRKMGIRAVL